jgi:hypothetical protein
MARCVLRYVDISRNYREKGGHRLMLKSSYSKAGVIFF